MDVTFDEDIPYYLPESKELIHEESKGVSLSLIQSVPLLSYQSLANNGSNQES